MCTLNVFDLALTCIWPGWEQIAKIIINAIKEKYLNVQSIIDSIEFKIETPYSLVLHKMTYSYYKSNTSVKTIVGITPGCSFTFTSQTHSGSILEKTWLWKVTS